MFFHTYIIGYDSQILDFPFRKGSNKIFWDTAKTEP